MRRVLGPVFAKITATLPPCDSMAFAPLPPLSKLSVPAVEEAPPDLAVYFAHRSTRPLARINLETGGLGGCLTTASHA